MATGDTPISDLIDDVYGMNHGNRGTAIIFNHRVFDKKTYMGERKGTDMDAHNLYDLFSEMGFNVVCKQDFTTQEMKAVMTKVARDDHSLSDCLVVSILTHGEEGGKVYGRDGKVDLNELVAPLKTCKSLAGKPKLFFIQACRGQNFDSGLEVTDALPSPEEDMEVEPLVYTIPAEADFLMAYSSVPGHYSWRNQERGSWFVQALVEVFRANWKRMELLHMMTRVSKKVAFDFQSNCSGPLANKKQVPCLTSMLTREIYFTPSK